MKKIQRLLVVGICLIMSGVNRQGLCSDVDHQCMIEQSNIDPYRCYIKKLPYIRKKKDKGKIDNQFLALQKLQTAICWNDYKGVERLLRDKVNPVNPNALLPNKKFPLEYVWDSKMARLLICHDALVHQRNEQGQTPLFSAIEQEYFEIARVLLRAGADINDPDNDGNTPLHYAIKSRNVSKVNFALYHAADQTQCNQQGESADTIIKQLGWKGLEACRESMETFFSAGDIFIKDRSCNSSELLRNDGYLLKQLLMPNETGHCSSEIVIVEDILKEYSPQLWQELQAPYSRYSLRAVALAQFVARRSYYQQKLLHAFYNKKFDVVEKILQKKPYIVYTHKDEGFAYKLMMYCIDYFLYSDPLSREYKIIRQFFYDGLFDFNVWDQGRELFLSYMIKKDTQGKYKDLLKSGVSVNLCDKDGMTPLWYAILLNDKEKIHNLLLYGAVVHRYMLFRNHQNIDSLEKEFFRQKCCVCRTHPDDMSNIPCVNRHIGNYICHNCYTIEGAQCPLCKRSLDFYGM